MTFIGVGAEGVKTAPGVRGPHLCPGLGTGKKYIQSGARYGAARKGAPVFMNLRISSQPIRNSSELTERDVLAFFNEKFLSDQILKEYVGGLKENGLLVINIVQELLRHHGHLLAPGAVPDQVPANQAHDHRRHPGRPPAPEPEPPRGRLPGADQPGDGHPARSGISSSASKKSWKRSWAPKSGKCWSPTSPCSNTAPSRPPATSVKKPPGPWPWTPPPRSIPRRCRRTSARAPGPRGCR